MHNHHYLPEIILPYPDFETVDTLANKYSLMHLADSLSLTIPLTWFANNPDNIPISLVDLPYPLVLKPGKSWLMNNGRWLHTSVRFADNPTQAQEIINSDPAFKNHPFMLQECVGGTGQGIFALYNMGKAIAFFSHRRLREKPPWGGCQRAF